MPTYVYRVTNTTNGKVYFGKTVDVAARWYDHLWDARHGSRHYFHRALRKHGASAFVAEVLAEYATDAEAGLEESRLIEMTPKSQRYNTAPGGTGGHTMTPEQLAQQYTIKPAEYARVQQFFDVGLTARAIAGLMQVPLKAVRSCARRMGISFQERRHKASLQPKPRRAYQYHPKAHYTPEQRAQLRAEVARRSNVARGAPAEVQVRALRLYTEYHLTAQQVADQLGLTRGVVRGVINRWYATLTTAEHVKMKHAHGSAVRSGARNPNSDRKDGMHFELAQP
jgi:group I intron endonuclease